MCVSGVGFVPVSQITCLPLTHTRVHTHSVEISACHRNAFIRIFLETTPLRSLILILVWCPMRSQELVWLLCVSGYSFIFKYFDLCLESAA